MVAESPRARAVELLCKLLELPEGKPWKARRQTVELLADNLIAAAADSFRKMTPQESPRPHNFGVVVTTVAEVLHGEPGPARYRNEAGQLVEDDDVPDEDR